MGEERTFSAKQVATRIGTDAKQLRKFFRDPDSGYDAVGQGGRYDFPEADLEKIKTAFDAWSATKTRRNRQPRTATKVPIVPTPRRGRIKGSVYDQTLGQDELMDRCAGIPARMEKHNLMRSPDGRIVRKPEEAAVAVIDRDEEPEYNGPNNELQPIIDYIETRGDDDYDPSDYDFED